MHHVSPYIYNRQEFRCGRHTPNESLPSGWSKISESNYGNVRTEAHEVMGWSAGITNSQSMNTRNFNHPSGVMCRA